MPQDPQEQKPPPNDQARQLALLKQLQARGLTRASDFFASREASAAGSASADAATSGNPSRSRRSPLDRFFPDAEWLQAACGGACRRIVTAAELGNARTPQGYQCPVAAYGGPPAPAALAALTGDPRWADVDPAHIVYLDTETTSLALGTGTYTFLIGLGRFAGDRFITEQYFMEDYAGEAALVEACDQAFEQAQALVSYNGRTFDVPLLESRWRLQRRRPRFPELHLDLLHYSRRLWRLRLPECSLGRVEQEILGITRLSDVNGSWVPRIYFDFTRGIRPERIVPVFDHHAQDIFSLGALAAAVLWAFDHPDDERFAHAEDQWGLARLYEIRGRTDEAMTRMEAAVLAARDEDFGFRLAMHLARVYKRRGRPADAVAIWESRVPQCTAERLDPLVELAKHCEHTLRDYAAARRWAERALRLLEGHLDLGWLTDSPEVAGEGSGSITRQLAARQHAALNLRLARLDGRRQKEEDRRQAAEKPRKRRKRREDEGDAIKP